MATEPGARPAGAAAAAPRRVRVGAAPGDGMSY
jgi:hypothetical protein